MPQTYDKAKHSEFTQTNKVKKNIPITAAADFVAGSEGWVEVAFQDEGVQTQELDHQVEEASQDDAVVDQACRVEAEEVGPSSSAQAAEDPSASAQTASEVGPGIAEVGHQASETVEAAHQAVDPAPSAVGPDRDIQASAQADESPEQPGTT